jgi:hypothetical protein
MIFDSKRRQAREAEAEATTLAEAPYAETMPVGTDRFADRGAYLEDDPALEPAVADARTDEPVAERAVTRPAERAVDRTSMGIDDRAGAQRSEHEDLEPLFPTDVAENFRRGWDAVQIGFVDDPRQAVQKADELVNQVLQSLSETFIGERGRVEAQVSQAGPISTEDLRVALRRYRSFLHRLLSL